MALASVVAGGLVVRVESGFGAGAATFVTRGVGRCTGVTALGVGGAVGSARGRALAADAPGGTAVAAELGLGGGGAVLGSREEIFVMTTAIATPVATAEIPTVIQLRVARRGAVAIRKASFELAGMGGGSGATIVVASWLWALVDHRFDERRDGTLDVATAGGDSSSSATIISGSTSITSPSLGSGLGRPTRAK